MTPEASIPRRVRTHVQNSSAEYKTASHPDALRLGCWLPGMNASITLASGTASKSERRCWHRGPNAVIVYDARMPSDDRGDDGDKWATPAHVMLVSSEALTPTARVRWARALAPRFFAALPRDHLVARVVTRRGVSCCSPACERPLNDQLHQP